MDAQTVIVMLIAAAAGVFVGRKLLRQLRGKEEPGCEKCEPDRVGSTNKTDH